MNSLQLQIWCQSAVLVLFTLPLLSLAVRDMTGLKTSVFLSPKFVMTPGSVVNRFYQNIKFPRGHIGIKRFNAEVVDSSGNPVSLQETYLHHWVVGKYYQRKGVTDKETHTASEFKIHQQSHNSSDHIYVRNSGICQNLGQYFGLGSETRKTATAVPDPYAIETGNPDDIPDGYEERWVLNVHAIDTRGVVDKLGCTECRCNLYNVTIDEYGRHLSPDYVGGLYCCYDQTQCRVKPGVVTASKELYLRYAVEWVDWSAKLLPVKIYIFDVTYTLKGDGKHHCVVEYEVEKSYSGIHSKKTSFVMPRGGHVVYGVAHQHSGGIGSTLFREDGRALCSSVPAYGKGAEAGNEAGYIVGMSTCYPRPGSVKIADGERLVLVSNYSSTQMHTGVMGLFYILVADQLPMQETASVTFDPKRTNQRMNSGFVPSGILVVGVMLVVVALVVGRRQRTEGGDVYRPITS